MPMICICSPQGGSGRSTLAVNLASAYTHRGNKALLIDFNVQNAMPLHFALNEAKLPGFVPHIRQASEWSQFIHKVDTNLFLLPYGEATFAQHREFEAMLLRDPEAVNRGLSQLEQYRDLVIIVDLPSGPHSLLPLLQPWADLTIATLLPDGIAPVLQHKLDETSAWGLVDAQTHPLFYVLNQTEPRHELSHDVEVHLKRTLGERLLGCVHRDSSVPMALSSQKLLREYRPGSAALFDFDAIENNITALLDITVGTNGANIKLPGNAL